MHTQLNKIRRTTLIDLLIAKDISWEGLDGEALIEQNELYSAFTDSKLIQAVKEFYSNRYNLKEILGFMEDWNYRTGYVMKLLLNIGDK